MENSKSGAVYDVIETEPKRVKMKYMMFNGEVNEPDIYSTMKLPGNRHLIEADPITGAFRSVNSHAAQASTHWRALFQGSSQALLQ